MERGYRVDKASYNIKHECAQPDIGAIVDDDFIVAPRYDAVWHTPWEKKAIKRAM
ncbi:MAG TPA: hypothetical protein VHK70_10925 [Burkholderiaceae bacterium]|jgi:hypothetical protein|nr:hypothetical protein [Burkholderiaceae bacterium]